VAGLIDDLKRVELFSGLSQRQLKHLARDFKEREFRSGTIVVQQGEMSGADFFVIAEGEASVSVNGKKVGRLVPGDHFGELALIGEQVRQATVTAAEPLRCLAIKSWSFRRFVKANPNASWNLIQYLVRLITEEREQARAHQAAAERRSA
jgi:CRP-like cAMP-binding protein